ncbi:hypothetical protein PsYK624_112770 [Phanerochaete sordida]|uniref:F-box domain-containing protein n=1 Tax=Phanerochaete sordida TaxID=48140 RepID=A0A9P3LIF3_9APHY|nr:hypothetical protein PsYK624_112770 [Phanerochaete sordida]
MASPHVITSQNVPGIEQLPQELVDRIVDQLGPDIRALKICALLSRRWHPRSSRNLSRRAWLHVRSSDDQAELMRSVDEQQAFLGKISCLSLAKIKFEPLHVVKALPRLRELNITDCDIPWDGPDAVRAWRAEPTTRTLSVLEMDSVHLILAHRLLLAFSAVDTLRIRLMGFSISLPDCLPSPRPHLVKKLEVTALARVPLQYLSATLDSSALKSLKVDIYHLRQFDHPAMVHDFVQAIGHGLCEYHHVVRAVPLPDMPATPRLSTFTGVKSVTLTVEIPVVSKQLQAVLAFVESLPVGLRSIKVVCRRSFDGEEALVWAMQAVRWTTLFQGLERCRQLSRLEIRAEPEGWAQDASPLAFSPAAQAVVLGALPETLRRIVAFA